MVALLIVGWGLQLLFVELLVMIALCDVLFVVGCLFAYC